MGLAAGTTSSAGLATKLAIGSRSVSGSWPGARDSIAAWTRQRIDVQP